MSNKTGREKIKSYTKYLKVLQYETSKKVFQKKILGITVDSAGLTYNLWWKFDLQPPG